MRVGRPRRAPAGGVLGGVSLLPDRSAGLVGTAEWAGPWHREGGERLPPVRTGTWPAGSGHRASRVSATPRSLELWPRREARPGHPSPHPGEACSPGVGPHGGSDRH